MVILFSTLILAHINKNWMFGFEYGGWVVLCAWETTIRGSLEPKSINFTYFGVGWVRMKKILELRVSLGGTSLYVLGPGPNPQLLLLFF